MAIQLQDNIKTNAVHSANEKNVDWATGLPTSVLQHIFRFNNASDANTPLVICKDWRVNFSEAAALSKQFQGKSREAAIGIMRSYLRELAILKGKPGLALQCLIKLDNYYDVKDLDFYCKEYKEECFKVLLDLFEKAHNAELHFITSSGIELGTDPTTINRRCSITIDLDKSPEIREGFRALRCLESMLCMLIEKGDTGKIREIAQRAQKCTMPFNEDSCLDTIITVLAEKGEIDLALEIATEYTEDADKLGYILRDTILPNCPISSLKEAITEFEKLLVLAESYNKSTSYNLINEVAVNFITRLANAGYRIRVHSKYFKKTRSNNLRRDLECITKPTLEQADNNTLVIK